MRRRTGLIDDVERLFNIFAHENINSRVALAIGIVCELTDKLSHDVR